MLIAFSSFVATAYVTIIVLSLLILASAAAVVAWALFFSDYDPEPLHVDDRNRKA